MASNSNASQAYLDELRREVEELQAEEKLASMTGGSTEAITESYTMLAKKYLEDVLHAELTDPSHAYEAGNRLSYADWRESAAAADSRRENDASVAEATRDYYDAHARAVRGKGRGSGYGEYLAAARKEQYEAALDDASHALAESYAEFYDERESSEAGATFDQRLQAISYIASNSMTEREGLLYALAAGLSYEEASVLARGASLLGSMLDERFRTYTGTVSEE